MTEALGAWIVGGCVVGAFFRAVVTNAQSPLGRETLQDCFVAAFLGLAWAYPLPALGIIYPPFTFPPAWPRWVASGMMAGFAYLFLDLAKKALMAYVPALFAKYTGQREPPR